jgi:hypothetical protein
MGQLRSAPLVLVIHCSIVAADFQTSQICRSTTAQTIFRFISVGGFTIGAMLHAGLTIGGLRSAEPFVFVIHYSMVVADS